SCLGARRMKRVPYHDKGRCYRVRDNPPCRPALRAPHRYGRTEVLALCGERRAPPPLLRRAAEAKNRSGADCRHECLEFLGRIRESIPQYTASLSRPRTLED